MTHSADTPCADAPIRHFGFGPYQSHVQARPDGSFLITSAQGLLPSPQRYTEPLLRWAKERPDTVFLAQRDAHGNWRRLTYGQAAQRILPLAQALLDRGLNAERPLMVLSENSLEFALLCLAALHVGIPCAPVSPAYSLLSPSAERVRHAVQLLTPGLVYARDAARFSNAIEKAVPLETELWFEEGHLAGRPCTLLQDVANTPVTAAVQAAHQEVGHDTIAKFLFTSGSTKLPKAVINTHGMLMNNQQMFLQCFPQIERDPPVLVCWLPWHHTAGGNHNFGFVLYNGGSLYIDDGKPTPEGMATTINNLRDVSPTVYYAVPKGLETLTQAMKTDTQLRDSFYKKLSLIYPVGAALSAPLKQALDDLAVASCGARIPMTTSLGMTETAPFALSAHVPNWQAGMIGIPAPGLEIKLAPCADKLEVRYRGPNITPGYWRQPELTRESFDDEGFFCSGDAAVFHQPDQPEQGLQFNGRIAEDFKLISGTWVNVGSLRQQAIACGAPHVHDVVITGHDRNELGMLVFLLPSARTLARDAGNQASLADLAADPGVRQWAQTMLDTLAARSASSSQRIVRAMIMGEPASMELGEMTDKGSINQRNVLKTRAALVERLYATEPGAGVLLPGP